MKGKTQFGPEVMSGKGDRDYTNGLIMWWCSDVVIMGTMRWWWWWDIKGN